MPPIPLAAVFDDLPDPRRQTKNKLHVLTDILTVATCAVIGGAESWGAIAEYGRAKESFFRRFLPLDNGIPSADTFERVFAKLAPGAFAQAFGRWMAGACEATGLVPIAIDGKSARRAKRNTATGCLTVVSAWATENRLTLGQVAVPDGSNEIGVIPELLRTLDLAGAIMTIDAAGCQVENAQLIRKQGGHYLLAVKGNQPTLRAAVERVVEAACEADFVGVDGGEEIEDAHGRHEERYVGVFRKPEGIPTDWPDVAAVVQVNREREREGAGSGPAPPTTTSPATPGRRPSWGRSCGATGGSRRCTGCWTWCSGRTPAGCGRATPGPTWRWCGGPPCPSCGGHPARAQPRPSDSRPGGTTTTCSKC